MALYTYHKSENAPRPEIERLAEGNRLIEERGHSVQEAKGEPHSGVRLPRWYGPGIAREGQPDEGCGLRRLREVVPELPTAEQEHPEPSPTPEPADPWEGRRVVTDDDMPPPRDRPEPRRISAWGPIPLEKWSHALYPGYCLSMPDWGILSAFLLPKEEMLDQLTKIQAADDCDAFQLTGEEVKNWDTSQKRLDSRRMPGKVWLTVHVDYPKPTKWNVFKKKYAKVSWAPLAPVVKWVGWTGVTDGGYRLLGATWANPPHVGEIIKHCNVQYQWNQNGGKWGMPITTGRGNLGGTERWPTSSRRFPTGVGQYGFRVRAANGYGWSPWSKVEYITVTDDEMEEFTRAYGTD